MSFFKEYALQYFVSKNILTQKQKDAIDGYNKLGLFSVRNELLFLISVSVLFFTSGIGVLVYKNIDSIGHQILLIALFVCTVACFYFAYKKANGFQKEQFFFKNPLYDYLVTLTTLLGCILIGYFQYNLKLEYTNYNISSLLAGIFSVIMAYYFDSTSALTVSISSFATFVGLSLSPYVFINGSFTDETTVLFSAILFGIILLVWEYFTVKTKIKLHFGFVFLMFAVHIINVACISGLNFDIYWWLCCLVLLASTYYFYQKSFQYKSIALYVFTLLYGYIGFNQILVNMLYRIDFLSVLLIYCTPFYLLASIVFFIKAVKKFNAHKHDED